MKLQMTLHNRVAAEDNSEAYGDHLQLPKPEKTLRVLCKNVDRISLKAFEDKSKKVVSKIKQLQADVVALQEVGVNWDKAAPEDQMHHRLQELFHPRSFLAHNTNEPTCTAQQYGGVGIITTMEATHRVLGHSRDPRNLGRWTSVLLNGKESRKVRIVSVYSPNNKKYQSPGLPMEDKHGVKKVSPMQLHTVYSQHSRHIRSQHIFDKDPLQLLREDLRTAINSWLGDQEDLVICLDANEDVRNGPLTSLLRDLGLQDIILAKHMASNPPPATQARNRSAVPIDAIFTTMNPLAVKSGYSAFGDGIPGDHRMLWVDFPFTTIFGNNPPHLNRIFAPRFNVKDPRVVKTYCKEVTHAYLNYGVPELGRLLREQTAAKEIIPAQETHLKLDKLVHTIRMEVADRVRKKKMGAVPWSPEMQTYFDERKLWTLVVKYRKKVRLSSRKIRRLMKKVKNRDALQIDAETAQLRRNEAHKAFLVAKKKAPNMRRSHLQGMAEALARKNHTDPEKELKSLQHRERQRQTARRVKRIRQKYRSGMVTKLYQTVNGVRTLLGTKATMEKGCETENEGRFSRSHPTAFMMEPLLSALGVMAEKEAAEQVLAGTYDIPDELDRYTKLLLQAMKRPAHVPVIPPESLHLTNKAFAKAWKKQKATTSSESKALSYGHYIAGAHNALIAEIDAALLSAPYELGFSPETWEVITDVELLKKLGVYDVEQMRTIQLMVASFNMNNKRLGRQMMAHAEEHNLLAKEQYGSRKGHKSIDAGLNKVLTADICRQQRRAAALLSNDAKQCYDRMNHSPTALAMRAVGMPKEPVTAMFNTLQNAQHHVSTAYGVALTWYGGLKRKAAGLLPLMGIGQGNGAGPAAYAVLSSLFVKVLDTAGYGAFLLSAISLTVLRFVCYIFVDDSDLTHTARDVNATGESIVPEMQEAVDHWEGVLRATGGSISAPKSFWYLMDWTWSGTKWVYRTIADMPGEISIRVEDGTRQTLQRYDPDHAERTLGIFPAMDGNPVRQIQHLTEKVKDFCFKVRICRKKEKNDVWVAVTTTIMKTLEYPMRAICLSKQAWDDIMSPLLKTCLPAAGFASSFPRTLVYGPIEHMGLGLLHPWYHQELQHLEVFWEEISQKTLTGDLLQISLEELRLELGLPGYLTDAPYHFMADSATDCWLKTLWESCTILGLELEDPFAQLQLSREDDQFLMAAFISCGLFKAADLKILNECRTFLHVVTLADISTACGNRILQSAYNGERLHQGAHKYSWPRQPDALPGTHWQTWQQALDQCFIYVNSPLRTLTTPLTSWTVDPATNWVWWYHDATNRLFRKDNNFFTTFTSATRHRGSSYKATTFDAVLPTNSSPASVEKIDIQVFKLVGVSSHTVLPSAATLTTEVELSRDVTCSIPSADAWAVEELVMTDAGALVAQAIRDGTAIAVSDGSLKDMFGTSSFTLQGRTDDQKITGRNAVPGEPLNQSSYRSELAGIAGVLVTLFILCKAYNITEGHIEIGLDGEQAMQRIFEDDDPTPSQPDYDLIYDLRAKLLDLPIKVTGRHVKGHQDKDATIQSYDRWSLLNMEMDTGAKDFWIQAHLLPRPNHRFGNERVVVKLDGKKLTSFHKTRLYQEVYGRYDKDTPTKLHWQNREGIAAEDIDKIHWHALGKAFGTMPFGMKRWFTKHASGHCAVGHMTIRRRHTDHSECPRCQETDETTKHVLQCNDARAIACWQKEITRLHKWMGSVNTHPTLQTAILKRLAQWRSNSPLTPLPVLSPEFTSAIEEQDSIGWWNFLLGRVSTKFATLQEAYYISLGSDRGGRTWLSALIRESADISFHMWEHRNNILHNTMTPRDQAILETLRQQIKDEFAKGLSTLLQSDQHWLQDKPRLLEMDLPDTRKWLLTLTLARQAHRDHFDKQRASLNKSRAFMERWLKGTQAPPPPPADSSSNDSLP